MEEKENIDANILLINPLLKEKTTEIDIATKELWLYQVGMEVECDSNLNFNNDDFKNIENIIEVNNDDYEKRFRIPIGIEGFKCLFNICEMLKKNCIKTQSGIHYHIDFTDVFEFIDIAFIEKRKEFILKELDKWKTEYNYGSRDVSYVFTWVRIQPQLKTFEFRIGEMSFDYKLIIKRILHLQEICKTVKQDILLHKVETELERIKENQVKYNLTPNDKIKQVIKNRKIII